MAPTWCPFPSFFGAEVKVSKDVYFQDWWGRFPGFIIMREGWFSSLTSSHGLFPEKGSVAAPMETRNNEEGSWSLPLSIGPRRTPPQNHLQHQLKQKVIEKMKQRLKRPRGLPWPPKPAPLKGNDHRGPALRWSLLILVMELRKNGLEVGESIYSNFIWSAVT